MADKQTQLVDPEDRLGLTPEQWEWFQRHTHGFGEQDENGVDLSLLRENLKLTPTERIEKMRKALELVLEIERARTVTQLRHPVTRPSRV